VNHTILVGPALLTADDHDGSTLFQQQLLAGSLREGAAASLRGGAVALRLQLAVQKSATG